MESSEMNSNDIPEIMIRSTTMVSEEDSKQTDVDGETPQSSEFLVAHKIKSLQPQVEY